MSIITYNNSYNLQNLFNNNYYTIIDDSAFIWDANHKFKLLNSLAQIMLNNKRKLYLPKALANKLLEYVKKNSNLPTGIGLNNMINSLIRNDIICLITNDNQISNINREIMAEITRIRMKNSVLLITANDQLAHDINERNSLMSQQYGKKTDVLWLNNYNNSQSISKNNFSTTIQANSNIRTVTYQTGKANRPVTIAQDITKIPNIPLKITDLPGEQSVVRTGIGQSVRLLSCIGNGGEGIVYHTNQPGLVAKIYKAGLATKRHQAKIELMIKNPLHKNGICYPQQALYNNQNEFVGFLMPEAQGEILSKVILSQLRKRIFPNWTKMELVTLCHTIMQKINFLHNHGILLGDIKMENILVKTPTEVYLVDCDSYQYGEFPCPVGTENFTPPELQHQQYSNILRTKENEHFSIAVLLFMILMNGKHPYSQQNGDSTLINIAKGQFSYCLGEIKSKNLPLGDWRFYWSNLPYEIKESFYNVFQKGAESYLPDQRYTTHDWLKKMQHYHYLLETNKIHDPMMLEIEPTRFKNRIEDYNS